MRLSFGTLSLCAWLGDSEATQLLDQLNKRGGESQARIFVVKGRWTSKPG